MYAERPALPAVNRANSIFDMASSRFIAWFAVVALVANAVGAAPLLSQEHSNKARGRHSVSAETALAATPTLPSSASHSKLRDRPDLGSSAGLAATVAAPAGLAARETPQLIVNREHRSLRTVLCLWLI